MHPVGLAHAGCSQITKQVHKKQWTWFKALYLACRYIPPLGLSSTAILWAGNHTREFCLPLIHYQNAALVILVSYFIAGWFECFTPSQQVFPYGKLNRKFFVGETTHSFLPPDSLFTVILLVRCYVFLGRRRWFLIFSIIAVSLSLAVQAVSVFGETCLVDIQFMFTGKYGCFRNWRTQRSRYVGVSVLCAVFMFLTMWVHTLTYLASVEGYYREYEISTFGRDADEIDWKLLPLIIDGISLVAILRVSGLQIFL